MRCLVIGGDAAGMTAASQIRRRQPDWPITVLEKGRFVSYAACGMPYAISGEVSSSDELQVFSAERFRTERNIDVRTGWEAIEIDPAAKIVRAAHADGEEDVPYDRLLVATGARPIVPPWDGVDARGVVVLRNLEDLAELEAFLDAEAPRRAVVVGAGYVGLEMAEALHRRGLSVTVLEKADGVMGDLDPKLTELVRAEMGERCDLRLGATVTGFETADGSVRAVRTDGGSVDADVAIVALGVRPEVALAERAGVELGPTGAIAVDATQRTSVDGVWAAGDCAESLHRVTGEPTWIPLALGANRAGRVAGAQMAGGDDRFPGVVGSAVTRICELAIARTGLDPRAAERAGIAVRTVEATTSDRAHYIQGHRPVWVKLVYREDDRRLVGALLAGHDPALGARCDTIATAITASMTVDELADLDLTYAPPFSPVWGPILRAATRAGFEGRSSR